MSTPAFTPPTVEIHSYKTVGAGTMARVIIAQPYREYMMLDPDPAVAETRALEAALHAEYAKLEQQRALVRLLKRQWKARKVHVG
jgi:hypothetical protein